MRDLSQLIILFRGAGDLATGAAVRLYNAGLRRLVMLEIAEPMAVRRTVSFSEAVYAEEYVVESVRAERAASPADLPAIWSRGAVAVLVDPDGGSLAHIWPDVEVDATIAKRNVTGVNLKDAPLVIGLGPGFIAGEDVHCVIETNRGISMGRVIRQGGAQPNTGKPGMVMGYDVERVLRSPASGRFETTFDIGDKIGAGDSVGSVDGQPVITRIGGTIRGLLRPGLAVDRGAKLGDVEPRENVGFELVSDKGLALGGGILEAILARELGVDPSDTRACRH